MRRILREAGEIPDMNAITEGIKYRLGFVEEGNPTPEILKNYMDVSTSPLHIIPCTAANPSRVVDCHL